MIGQFTLRENSKFYDTQYFKLIRFICAIPALMHTVETISNNERGNYQKANKTSRLARSCNIGSSVCIAIVFILWIIGLIQIVQLAYGGQEYMQKILASSTKQTERFTIRNNFDY